MSIAPTEKGKTMSILIKGMEMPTEQYGKMVITLYPNGHVAEYVGDIGRVWEAVPVVRCKDCIVKEICRYKTGLGDNGFCSQGERKDDGN